MVWSKSASVVEADIAGGEDDEGEMTLAALPENGHSAPDQTRIVLYS